MTSSAALAREYGIVLRDDAPATGDLRADALRGLSSSPKTLPCKYLYDETGALLFEHICTTEAYYPTRVELGILEQHSAAMAARLGPRCTVIEFGSGSGRKTRMLLDQLEDPVAYIPIDISREQLIATAIEFATLFPALEVLPVCADYTRDVQLPAASRAPRRRVVFFPGSTIGNFEPSDAAAFLARMAQLVGAGGAVLIGVDRRKDAARLELAYNDPEGVTAAFNRNLLVRLQRELGADIDPDAFMHRAHYDRERGRIEMHLVSTRDQVVRIPDGPGAVAELAFAAGEPIVTEYSYKYTRAGFTALAGRADLDVECVWSDAGDYFSVFLLRA